MIREFLLGFIQVQILFHASREEVYGLWIIRELERHGFQMSPGTLYPILHSLEKKKLLKSRDVVVLGKVRKYYRITPVGEKALGEVKKKIRKLVEEIIE